jgi:glycosyltransferase involved in cell wall biosynthesis
MVEDRPPAPRVTVIRPYAALPSEGGSNDRYLNLCRALAARGARVTLLCSDFIHNAKRKRTRAEQDENRRQLPFVVPISSTPYRHNVSAARIIHEIIFGIRSLVYLITHPRPDALVVGEPLFGVGWMTLLYGALWRVPVLADVIDLWPEADTRIVDKSVRHFFYALLVGSRAVRLRLYTAASCVSASYAEKLRLSAASVFYWGSELRPASPLMPHAGEKLAAVYAGSFGDGYDLKTVLAAAEILHREKPGRFRFVIAGDGPQRALVQEAHDKGIVDYRGTLDKPRLIELYGRCDIGLLPYQTGSTVAMPIKFFDYVNFGLYILTSLSLEAGNLVHTHKMGDVYAGTPADLAGKLGFLDDHRDILAAGRKAAAEMAAIFAVETQYGRFADFVLQNTA